MEAIYHGVMYRSCFGRVLAGTLFLIANLACGEDDIARGPNDLPAQNACMNITKGVGNKLATANSVNEINDLHEFTISGQPYNLELNLDISGGNRGVARLVADTGRFEYRFFTKEKLETSIEFEHPELILTGPRRAAPCPDQKLNDYAIYLAAPGSYDVRFSSPNKQAWLYVQRIMPDVIPDGGVILDTGSDTPSDTGSDAGTDTGADTGTDTPVDAAADTSTDATSDTPNDVLEDSDAASDAPSDVTQDPDVPTDASGDGG